MNEKKEDFGNGHNLGIILIGMIVLHFVPVAFAIGSMFMAVNELKLWWLAAIFSMLSLIYTNSKYQGKVKK